MLSTDRTGESSTLGIFLSDTKGTTEKAKKSFAGQFINWDIDRQSLAKELIGSGLEALTTYKGLVTTSLAVLAYTYKASPSSLVPVAIGALATMAAGRYLNRGFQLCRLVEGVEYRKQQTRKVENEMKGQLVTSLGGPAVVDQLSNIPNQDQPSWKIRLQDSDFPAGQAIISVNDEEGRLAVGLRTLEEKTGKIHIFTFFYDDSIKCNPSGDFEPGKQAGFKPSADHFARLKFIKDLQEDSQPNFKLSPKDAESLKVEKIQAADLESLDAPLFKEGDAPLGHEALQEEIKELQSRLEELQQENGELRSQVLEMRQFIADQELQSVTKVAELQEGILYLQEARKPEEPVAKRSFKPVSSLPSDSSEEVSALKEEVASLKETVRKLKGLLQNSKAHIEELESKLEFQNEEEEAIASYKNIIKRLQTNLTAVQDENKRLLEVLAESREENSQLKNREANHGLAK